MQVDKEVPLNPFLPRKSSGLDLRIPIIFNNFDDEKQEPVEKEHCAVGEGSKSSPYLREVAKILRRISKREFIHI